MSKESKREGDRLGRLPATETKHQTLVDSGRGKRRVSRTSSRSISSCTQTNSSALKSRDGLKGGRSADRACRSFCA